MTAADNALRTYWSRAYDLWAEALAGSGAR